MFHDVGVVVGRSEEIEHSEGHVSVNAPDELAGPCLGELSSIGGIQFINIQVHQSFRRAFDNRIVVVPQRHTSLVAKSYALCEPFYIATAERKQRRCIVQAFIAILQHFGLGRTGCSLHFFDRHAGLVQYDISPKEAEPAVGDAEIAVGFTPPGIDVC